MSLSYRLSANGEAGPAEHRHTITFELASLLSIAYIYMGIFEREPEMDTLMDTYSNRYFVGAAHIFMEQMRTSE